MENLPGLMKWTVQLKTAKERAAMANMTLEEEKRKIVSETVDTLTYCQTMGISRVTLTKRRNMGNVPFLTIGGRYRYFLPKKGGEYVGK